MRPLAKLVVVLACIAGVPAVAFGQASIAGTVRDTSGAVLPGVTVEASSPALIEKVRSAVTDGTGQFQITNLNPGVYSVTYMLPGFSTVKREGIELTGSFTATVNAELRLGALEETITVTGETPVVDVQNTNRQRVLDREIIDTIPSGRNEMNIGVLIPGVTLYSGGGSGQDVGGQGNDPQMALQAHGSSNRDTGLTLNGVSIDKIGGPGSYQIIRLNPAAVQEVSVDISGVSAERHNGGVRINQVPREGGNTYNGTFYVGFANQDMASSNFTDDLRERGLSTPNSINRVYSLNPGFGGPLKRDRLWFYFAAQKNEALTFAPGAFFNRNANDPNLWTYEPDTSRPLSSKQAQTDGNLRLAWQATPKNKIGFTWNEANICYCPDQVSSIVSLEAAEWRPYRVQRIVELDWTNPVTSRFLLEAGAVYNPGLSSHVSWPELNPLMASVTEQSTGLKYRADAAYNNRWQKAVSYRVAASYITGSHTVKVGVNDKIGRQTRSFWDTVPYSYRFNNGIPNRITQAATPYDTKVNLDHGLGVYVQDKWTIRGLTFGYGARYDYFSTSFPEQHIGPATLFPTRDVTFPQERGAAFHDLTPKLGASYDPFGHGKTAFKVSLNKYLGNMGTESLATDFNPTNLIVRTANRSWNDANRNFIPDCDLVNVQANGECGRLSNTAFGLTRPGATYDMDLVRGFGKRLYNWEFSAGVQHELMPRVSGDVTYFRRWYGNFAVTDDRAVAATDFDAFSITAPRDPRLPGGGGQVISGLLDLDPSKFGTPTDNFVTRANNYGKQVQYWQGFDIVVNARPRPGLILQGGTSTGRTVTDNCEIQARIPEMVLVDEELAPNVAYCHQATNFLTQVKFLAAYTVPRVDVQVSAALQSLPGPQVSALFNASNQEIRPSLGRDLSAGSNQTVTVNLVSPGAMYGERMNQLDLRVAKLLRFAKTRTSIGVDIFNVLNSNAVLQQNDAFAVWQQPITILLARFVRLSAQFDF